MNDLIPSGDNIRERVEVSIFDESNPYSLINIAPPAIMKGVKLAFEHHREKFDWEEYELRDYVKPGAIVNRLRHSFWIEYERAIKTEGKMVLKNVYMGVCHKEQFYGLIEKSYGTTALWIITQTKEHQKAVEETFQLAAHRIQEILKAPLKKQNGDFDTALAGLMMKIYDKLDNRIHGGVVQRMETKQLVMKKDMDRPMKQVDIDTELLEIKKQLIENQQMIKPEVNYVESEIIEVKREDSGKSEGDGVTGEED